MAYYDDHRQAPPAPAPASKAARAAAIALGLGLTGASVASLIYLSDRWREAAPYREARAIEAAERRAVAEAARAAEEPARAQAPVAVVPVPPSDVPIGDVAVQTAPRPSLNAAAPGRRIEYGPLRWLSAPRFDIPRDILEKPGPERVSVRFECRVDTAGSLYRCVGSETPRGFGLLPAARQALPAARMAPLTENGRVVEGSVTFGYSWTRPRAISAPGADRPASEPSPALDADEPPAPPVKPVDAGNASATASSSGSVPTEEPAR